MISQRVSGLTVVLVLGGAILLAALNQFTPETSAVHVPPYVIALVGKYPAQEVTANLHRFKQLMETGKVTDTTHAVSGKFPKS